MARNKDTVKKAPGKAEEVVKSVTEIIGQDAAAIDQPGATKQDKERVDKLLGVLMRYQSGKALNDSRIIENDRWYKSQHWEVMREKDGSKKKNVSLPEPVTAFLWNTLANRHGDLMDAFPEPVFMEREPSDRAEAERLSKIVKYVLDRNKFRKTYSDCAWYKVKSGTSCYHVHWDSDAENGLGDIAVSKTDILRLYWEPGVDNIQDSRYVFALSLVDIEDIKRKYPVLNDRDLGSGAIDLKLYNDADKSIMDTKAVMIDCYTKELDESGNKILHLDKLCGGVVVDTTRKPAQPTMDPETGEMIPGVVKGLYDHGLYPFVFDTLFPEEHNLLGFGMVDVIKSPQMYIDKLDQILTMNALVSGKQRILFKDNGAIPEDKLADMSLDFIPCKGGVKEGEDYAVLQGKPLSVGIIQHRQNKIAELKEVSGANDFNRGSSGGGITAASAIMALQEAGNKLARAMVSSTYDGYSEICYQIIELIAQFYNEPRKFRITNDDGETDYVEFDNTGLKPQPMEAAVPGMEQELRKPVFDIVVHAEKHSPYSALASNAMAKELFSAGFFNPEMAPAALTALEIMSFDGKDRIQKVINQRYQETMAVQQAQAEAQAQVGQNQELLQMAAQYIQKLTGKNILEGADIGQGGI